MNALTAPVIPDPQTIQAPPGTDAGAEGFGEALSRILTSPPAAAGQVTTQPGIQDTPDTAPEASPDPAAGPQYSTQAAPAVFQLPAEPAAVAVTASEHPAPHEEPAVPVSAAQPAYTIPGSSVQPTPAPGAPHDPPAPESAKTAKASLDLFVLPDTAPLAPEPRKAGTQAPAFRAAAAASALVPAAEPVPEAVPSTASVAVTSPPTPVRAAVASGAVPFAAAFQAEAASVPAAAPPAPPVPAAADPAQRSAVPAAAAPGAARADTPVIAAAPQPHAPVVPVSAPVQTSSAPPPAGFAAQLARPVLTLASAGMGAHTITVAVNPENLGPVTVQAHISSAGVRVELFATNSDGRDALRQILPDLKRDLAGTGLNATLDLSSGGQPGSGHGSRDEFMNRRAPNAYTAATDGRQLPMNSQASRVTPDLHGANGTLDVMA